MPDFARSEARIVSRTQPDLDRPVIGLADLLALAVLLAGAPVAAMLSTRKLRSLATRAAGLLPSGFRQQAALETFVTLGGLSHEQAVALRRGQLEHRLTSLAFLLRQLTGKAVYEIAVDGQEHVGEALAGGRGAVIWIADFVFASEVVRQAFHSLGWPLTHMIRPDHGFSSTRFGVSCLNPIHARVGNRYVRDYVVFDRSEPEGARRRLERRLGENGLISMLACAYEGRTLAESPFMRGRLALAVGAPAMAFKAGCPILPVFTHPSPAPPHFTVSIGKPLMMRSAERRTAILEAATDYFSRLAPHVEAHPELWRGWPSLGE